MVKTYWAMGYVLSGSKALNQRLSPAPTIHATIAFVAAASCRNISTSAGAGPKRIF
jgi:hypothetical protein